jgi:hypothetical protein
MQIKELTTEQFRILVREVVREVVIEVVIEVLEEYIDLDEGKRLKPSVVERLLRQQQQAKAIPVDQVMQKLGINWNEL